MRYYLNNSDDSGSYYLAGERVAPGRYRQVDGGRREVLLENEDVLPASLDGHVACYSRVNNTWSDIVDKRRALVAA